MSVYLAKNVRTRPDPTALATKGRQTSFESDISTGNKSKVRVRK